MGAIERANQRLEAWVKAQQDQQRDRKMDQRQQPHQGGEQGNQQVQQQPRPTLNVLGPEVQHRFRYAMYQALHMVKPQARQQQLIQQHQPQGQPQGQQPMYRARRQQQAYQQQAYQQQAYQQQVQQQQVQQQQVQQQQVQQQQAQLPRQPQHQPQHQPKTQNKHAQEEGPASFRTDRAHYLIIRRIADSSEGTVSLARSTPKSGSPELRIVKSVGSNGSDPREAHMLYAAGSHTNILKIFECAYEAPLRMAHMCMEYCNGGDLHELLCTYDALSAHVPDQLILKAAVDIADGLAFIHHGYVRNERTEIYSMTQHAPRIIHRDLKTTNIFIRLNGVGELPTFVVGDFGQAFYASEAETRFHGGTAGFRAPEFEKKPEVAITDKADVYSFAMTIVTVCQTRIIQSDKFKCASDPRTLRLPRYLQGYRLENLLHDCLAIDPKDRPRMSPSGVLTYTRGYRAQLKSMVPGPRAATVEVARAA